MIIALIKKYIKWYHKISIYKKYGSHTKYHYNNPLFDIGEFTYGVPQIHTYDNCTKLTIGKYCSISAGVEIILGGNHRTNWISTFPFRQEVETFPHWNNINKDTSFYRGDVIIGNDVWIGRNALILSGAQIGDGAIIGAGSVVATNIPPYAICVGNPAKIIKYRFTPPNCEKLLKIKWWEWDTKKINKYLHLICSENIEQFLSTIELENAK